MFWAELLDSKWKEIIKVGISFIESMILLVFWDLKIQVLKEQARKTLRNGLVILGLIYGFN